MSKNIEFHPMPEENDKHQTPKEKNDEKLLEQPGWKEVDLDSPEEKAE